ncbi:MAG: hypothetical protein H0W02_09355 [Ktedonobacteraceae bacterium]|nr:hypothetical protein [Ktedonobacteraceae bacterium]
MPKKSASARSGAQRHKVKVQKNIELVRQSSRQAEELESGTESLSSVSTMDTSDSMENVSATTDTVEADTEAADSMEKAPVIETRATRRLAARKTVTTAREETTAIKEEATASTGRDSMTSAPRGNASARLAARRQGGQKSQQRAAATLVTSEHYRYVRRDLIFIAILAILMFTVLIILHFVPAIGG